MQKEDFAIVFLFNNLNDVEKSYLYATEGKTDVEIDWVIKNLGQEIISCYKNKIPYVILTRDQILENNQNAINGKTVLLRGSISLVKSFKENYPKARYLMQSSVSKWPKKLINGFIKHKVKLIDLREIKTFKEEYPFNIEVADVLITGYTGKQLIKNRNDLREYLLNAKRLPDFTTMIVSEPFEPLKDNLGNIEYKCIVVNNQVTSIARDTCNSVVIPKEVASLAVDFARAHKHLPTCYILNIVETAKGIDVASLSDLEYTNRFDKNNFDMFLQYIVE